MDLRRAVWGSRWLVGGVPVFLRALRASAARFTWAAAPMTVPSARCHSALPLFAPAWAPDWAAAAGESAAAGVGTGALMVTLKPGVGVGSAAAPGVGVGVAASSGALLQTPQQTCRPVSSQNP